MVKFVCHFECRQTTSCYLFQKYMWWPRLSIPYFFFIQLSVIHPILFILFSQSSITSSFVLINFLIILISFLHHLLSQYLLIYFLFLFIYSWIYFHVLLHYFMYSIHLHIYSSHIIFCVVPVFLIFFIINFKICSNASSSVMWFAITMIIFSILSFSFSLHIYISFSTTFFS